MQGGPAPPGPEEQRALLASKAHQANTEAVKQVGRADPEDGAESRYEESPTKSPTSSGQSQAQSSTHSRTQSSTQCHTPLASPVLSAAGAACPEPSICDTAEPRPPAPPPRRPATVVSDPPRHRAPPASPPLSDTARVSTSILPYQACTIETKTNISSFYEFTASSSV